MSALYNPIDLMFRSLAADPNIDRKRFKLPDEPIDFKQVKSDDIDAFDVPDEPWQGNPRDPR